MRATALFAPILLAACSIDVTDGLEAAPITVEDAADTPVQPTPDTVLPGQFLVSVDSMSASELAEALLPIEGAGLVAVDGLPGTWRFDTTQPIDLVVEHLDTLPGVRWAEPRVAVSALGVPNDPYYVYQWNLHLLDAPTVWDRATGSGILVAVVDTGVAPAWDAFVDLREGADFTGAGTNGQVDTDGHGSHVAGTIAQGTNNAAGVAGLAHGASILPVRVLADGSGTSDAVAAGIRYAVDEGAQVINLSLGSFYPSQVIEEACAYAADNGVLLFAASGNDGYTNYVSYPAAYPTTIAVGATRADDTLAIYSNGGTTLDLVAPGGDLEVDANGDGYADGILNETTLGGVHGFHFLQGTSMAAPHGTAAGALLLSAGASAADVRDLLTTTAIDLGAPGRDDDYGHGRIDVLAALDAVGTTTPTEPPVDLCDADRCADDLLPGDLVITEIMADPSTCTDASGEWLELVNRTSGTVQLAGLVLTDASGRTGTLAAGIVAAGEHVVVGRGDAQSFCGPEARSTYGTSLSLNNAGDQVFLTADGIELSRTSAWTGSTAGVSLALAPSAYATGDSWAESTEAYGDELASPGAAATVDEPVVVYDLSIDEVWPGELVVSEFMANPTAASDTYGEWVELHNTTTQFRMEVTGLVLRDNAGDTTIVEGVWVEPGQRIVVARGDADTFANPDVVPDAYYGYLALNNGGDSLTLANSIEDLDTVSWGSEGGVSGTSRELVDGTWLDATDELPSGDRGTPGF